MKVQFDKGSQEQIQAVVEKEKLVKELKDQHENRVKEIIAEK